jgi:hypothetical protein
MDDPHRTTPVMALAPGSSDVAATVDIEGAVLR